MAHRILWSHEGKASFRATELKTTCISQASSSSGCQNGTHGYLGFRFQAQRSVGSRRGVQRAEEERTCKDRVVTRPRKPGALPRGSYTAGLMRRVWWVVQGKSISIVFQGQGRPGSRGSVSMRTKPRNDLAAETVFSCLIARGWDVLWVYFKNQVLCLWSSVKNPNCYLVFP